MSKNGCKRPVLIKDKFKSSFVGLCGIILGVSSVYRISNFSVYLTSYIHEKQDFVTMHYGLFINLIFSFAMTFGMSAGGFLELKLGFFLTTLTGLIIVLVSNIFFLNVQNIWLCYILTFTTSTGLGIAYSLVGKNLVLYKPNKKGLLISAIMAIMNLFAGIYSFLGEKLINPDGYTLKENEEYYQYKYSSKTYLFFLLSFFSIPIGSTIFLLFTVEYKKDNKELNIEEESTKNKEEIQGNNEVNINEENNIEDDNKINDDKKDKEENILDKEIKTMNKKKNIKKVIKTFRFWRLSFVELFLSFSFSFILGTSRTFGAIIGIEGKALQLLMLFQSGALIIVGPILGILVDKKGPLIFLRIAAVICMIPGVLLTFFVKNTVIFTCSFIISILGLVSNITCFTPFIMEVYGIQESVILGGVMNIFAKLSEITTTVLAFVISVFYSKEEIIRPYQLMYLIGSGFCLLSFILLIFENNQKYEYEQEEDLGDLVEKGRFIELGVY